jgi:hypothetical protein
MTEFWFPTVRYREIERWQEGAVRVVAHDREFWAVREGSEHEPDPEITSLDDLPIEGSGSK